jgi:hypothetical protein
MVYPSLNRRHKAGLLLVLAAAGVSLLFEASAKQTAGVILLGLAATWLIGSLSVRTLWLSCSVSLCGVGLLAAGKPILDDWKGFQDWAHGYDRAVSDLRRAVAIARSAGSNQGGAASVPSPSDFMASRIAEGAGSKQGGAAAVLDYDPVAKRWNKQERFAILPPLPRDLCHS